MTCSSISCILSLGWAQGTRGLILVGEISRITPASWTGLAPYTHGGNVKPNNKLLGKLVWHDTKSALFVGLISGVDWWLQNVVGSSTWLCPSTPYILLVNILFFFYWTPREYSKHCNSMQMHSTTVEVEACQIGFFFLPVLLGHFSWWTIGVSIPSSDLYQLKPTNRRWHFIPFSFRQ